MAPPLSPFTMEEIVQRMNWIGAQDDDMRAYLRAECESQGHLATGEQLMTNPPIDTCWRCGSNFRKPDAE